MLREDLGRGGAEPELVAVILSVGQDSQVDSSPEDTLPLPRHSLLVTPGRRTDSFMKALS